MSPSKPDAFVRMGLRSLMLGICLTLVAFNVRRLLFAAAILRRGKPPETPSDRRQPDVLVLVACRDEASLVPTLSRHLAELDYPVERRRVVLIDDGSGDTTGELMREAAARQTNWDVHSLEVSVGKAAALNSALARHAYGELVYVLDADHRPDPAALRRVVVYFDDASVGGVNGRMVARNATATPIAYYSTVETLVHQLVTMRAKDRLDLAPALLGSNCAYRRAALEACGGFRPGALSEDYDLSLSMYRQGYRVRFAEDVTSYHQVPEGADGYLKQHVRWGRGIYDVARHHALAVATDSNLRLGLRLELLMLLAGYLDRAALLGAGVLTVLSFLSPRHIRFPWQIVVFALLTPLVQIAALFVEQRAGIGMWLRLPLVPLLFGLDVFAAVQGLLGAVLARPRQWTRTERASQHD